MGRVRDGWTYHLGGVKGVGGVNYGYRDVWMNGYVLYDI